MKGAAGVVLLAILAVAGLYLYARRSLPVVDGTIAVAGLRAPIDIIRDADGIPHVYASSKLDALFGLGFVHAQDRLWQMEFQRRIGFGRLSEIFGAATIPQDRFLRTVGFGRAARAAWTSTPDWAKEQIDAYVAGVNAFISTHRGSRLPPEFSLLGFEPEPFSGPDVWVWVKMMAWDLSANYSFELLRDDLLRTVGEERMAQLMPPYPVDGLSIVSKSGTTVDTEEQGGHGQPRHNSASLLKGPSASSHGSTVTSVLAQLVRTLEEGNPAVAAFLLGNTRAEALGSNNWVIDGTLSATGKPMLANDPHLSARIPSTWYLAHVRGGDFEVIGATLPGAPAVAIGRNRHIAWGETNVAADVEDFYRERVDPTGRFVEFRGTQEAIAIVPETILVKKAAPVQLNVRITRHGPLVSDALNTNAAESPRLPKPPPRDHLAFRWTALDPDDTTLPSFLRLNEARNWGEFTSALSEFVVPSQNFVYADVDGHIGYYAPGRIPIRASGDGSKPADGWSGDAEWVGWIPFEELPHLYDPPQHFIVTANHRPAPADYKYLLGFEWPEPYRAGRIVERLHEKRGLTVDDFARIQADTYSPHAAAVLPALIRFAKATEEPDKRALELVQAWNRNATGDSAGAAIFSAWFHHLAPAFVGDDLGPVVLDNYVGRFSYITRFVLNTLSSKNTAWCDDVRTPAAETCEQTITAALHEAVADLTHLMGRDMARWRWDTIHRAVFPHQGLDTVRALRPLISRSVPNGGDWSTVNVGPVAADALYEQHSVAGYRQIVDLSPANDSRFLDAVGESGHPFSKRYGDFLSDWQAVRHKKMRMERKDIETGATGHLKLTPR